MSGSEQEPILDAHLRHRLLGLFEQDERAGRLNDLDHYLRTFSGPRELVTEEYAAFVERRATDAVDEGRSLEDIGGYEVVRRIGGGGMGDVFVANDPVLSRQVAIKVLRWSAAVSESSLARFRREAEAAARVRHPDVCEIYDSGEQGGRPFLVMRFVDGPTLADRIGKSRLPAEDAVRIVARAARALHACHEAGLIHRDVKPANVILEGGADPVVTDFGIARMLNDQATKLTATGTALGSPAYMSPEQVTGTAIDRRTDVYSLGATLFELITGQRAFNGESTGALYRRVESGRFPRPSAVDPRISGDLECVCLKAMALDPRDRYDSAAELADDLDRFLGYEPVLARPVGLLTRFVRFTGRRPALVLGSASLVAIVLLIGLSWLQEAGANRDRREREFRRIEREVFAALETVRGVDDQRSRWLELREELIAGYEDEEASTNERRQYCFLLVRAARKLARDGDCETWAKRLAELGSSSRENRAAELDRAWIELRRGDVERAARRLRSIDDEILSGSEIQWVRDARLTAEAMAGSAQFPLDELTGGRPVKAVVPVKGAAGAFGVALITVREIILARLADGKMVWESISYRSHDLHSTESAKLVSSATCTDLNGDGRPDFAIVDSAPPRLHRILSVQGRWKASAFSLDHLIEGLAPQENRSFEVDTGGLRPSPIPGRLLLSLNSQNGARQLLELDATGQTTQTWFKDRPSLESSDPRCAVGIGDGSGILLANGAWGFDGRGYGLRGFAHDGEETFHFDFGAMDNLTVLNGVRAGGRTVVATRRDDSIAPASRFGAKRRTELRPGVYFWQLEAGGVWPLGGCSLQMPFGDHLPPGRLISGDLDGDGRDEVVIASSVQAGRGELQVLTVGPGERSTTPIGPLPYPAHRITTVADIDGDGDDEVMFAHDGLLRVKGLDSRPAKRIGTLDLDDRRGKESRRDPLFPGVRLPDPLLCRQRNGLLELVLIQGRQPILEIPIPEVRDLAEATIRFRVSEFQPTSFAIGIESAIGLVGISFHSPGGATGYEREIRAETSHDEKKRRREALRAGSWHRLRVKIAADGSTTLKVSYLDPLQGDWTDLWPEERLITQLGNGPATLLIRPRGRVPAAHVNEGRLAIVIVDEIDLDWRVSAPEFATTDFQRAAHALAEGDRDCAREILRGAADPRAQRILRVLDQIDTWDLGDWEKLTEARGRPLNDIDAEDDPEAAAGRPRVMDLVAHILQRGLSWKVLAGCDLDFRWPRRDTRLGFLRDRVASGAHDEMVAAAWIWLALMRATTRSADSG